MKEKLQAALKEALRSKNKLRLDTIRSVLAAIQYESMEKKVENLSDEQIVGLLQREVKKRREEIEFATQAKRPELTENLHLEIKTLEEFLPSQLSISDIEKILGDLKANDASLNMGTAMKVLKERYAGQYDGKAASEVAKRVFG